MVFETDMGNEASNWGWRRRLRVPLPALERWLRACPAIDQTKRPGVLAQIQVIVRKRVDN